MIIVIDWDRDLPIESWERLLAQNRLDKGVPAAYNTLGVPVRALLGSLRLLRGRHEGSGLKVTWSRAELNRNWASANPASESVPAPLDNLAVPGVEPGRAMCPHESKTCTFANFVIPPTYGLEPKVANSALGSSFKE